MLNNPDQLDTKIDFSSKAFKRYFFNTSWLFAERIIRLLVTFFVGILIIRYLGPDQFGLLSYALSFVGLFIAFGTLGLDTVIVRELLSSPEQKDELLGTAFFLRLIGSSVSVLFIILVTFIISEDPFTRVLILIIAASGIFQSFNVIDFYFQSRVLAKYTAIVQFSSLIVSSAIKILLIVLEAQLIYFAVVTTLEFLITGLSFVVVFRITGSGFSGWKLSRKLSVSLLKDAWPLMLSVLAITIYMKIDQVMLKNMLDEQQVGYYAAAVRLTEAWYFIPAAIVSSLFPAILNAKRQDEHLYMSRLQKLYDLLVFLAVLVALPVTLFSEQIIRILLGPEFITSASVLTIYIWGSVAVFLGIASNQYLVAENYTRISFYRTLVGVVLNILLNLLLIPLMGISGSAVATVVSYSVSVISITFNKKTSHHLKMLVKAVFMIDIILLAYKKLRKVE